MTSPDAAWKRSVGLAGMVRFLTVVAVVIGGIAGLIAYVPIMADIVLGFVTDDGAWGILAIRFLAGFSETFVPDVLRRIEANATE